MKIRKEKREENRERHREGEREKVGEHKKNLYSLNGSLSFLVPLTFPFLSILRKYFW